MAVAIVVDTMIASAWPPMNARETRRHEKARDGTGFWRPDSTSRRFRKLRIDHGLEDVTLYSLRHQAATTMIDSGVDTKTVSERLGNSVATVLGTYTRARTKADREAADLLGRLYATE
jgi:integrase